MAKKQKPEIRTVAIDDIIIENRLRTDLQNIKALAVDIKKNGLYQFPVVTVEGDKYRLIMGERRIRALQMNNATEVTVSIMNITDAEALVKAEYNENHLRADFLMTEKLAYADKLEVIEKAKAEARMKAGKKEDPVQNLAQGSETDPVQNLAQGSSAKKVRNIVAKATGLGSGTQYDKIKFIRDHQSDFTPEEFDKWNHGLISTNKMYNKLKPKSDTPKTSPFQKKDAADIIPSLDSLASSEELEALKKEIDTLRKENAQYKKNEELLHKVAAEEDAENSPAPAPAPASALSSALAFPPVGKPDDGSSWYEYTVAVFEYVNEVLHYLADCWRDYIVPEYDAVDIGIRKDFMRKAGDPVYAIAAQLVNGFRLRLTTAIYKEEGEEAMNAFSRELSEINTFYHPLYEEPKKVLEEWTEPEEEKRYFGFSEQTHKEMQELFKDDLGAIYENPEETMKDFEW